MVAQTPSGLQTQGKRLFIQLLEFIYTIAHLIGQGIVGIIRMIVPVVSIPQELVDPIGVLAILTIFLALSEVAKKLAWIVVGVGWLLIVIRIVMVLVKR